MLDVVENPQQPAEQGQADDCGEQEGAALIGGEECRGGAVETEALFDDESVVDGEGQLQQVIADEKQSQEEQSGGDAVAQP